MTKILKVQLLERSYPIYFSKVEQKLKSCIKDLIKDGRKCFILTDENIYSIYRDYIENLGIPASYTYIIPAGECSKSIKQYSEILSFLSVEKANRDSVLFAFGGGVIGDLAGFIAASYLRGIDFYQIPTSLLAMTDSSVGGKTGINLPEGKNLVGSFWQPKAVFIDTVFLNSLPPRQFASGMAEVIKYGMIADSSLFDALEMNSPITPNTKILPSLIRHCCTIKAKIVVNDEKETSRKNGRALLNLGHTFGHAIENVSGYGYYLHGEAISIGLYLASLLSESLDSKFSSKETKRVEEILAVNSLPIKLKKSIAITSLYEAMERDKKNRSNEIRFVVMDKLGCARTYTGVEKALLDYLFIKVGANA